VAELLGDLGDDHDVLALELDLELNRGVEFVQ
jgi:hypothetical protein